MNNASPLISVILPTYNRAYLIENSIRSVLQQTYQNFEIIIVDDGSTDNTEDVVKNIRDSRIKYIRCEVNKGANAARNIGIKTSLGCFIAFQDSDDEWVSNKLELHINGFENNSDNLAVVYSGFLHFSQDSCCYIPEKNVKQRNGNISSQILSGNFISTPAALVRKQCLNEIGYFDEELPRLQDWDLFIRLSLKYDFLYINKPTYNAYFTDASISSDNKAYFEALEIIVAKYLQPMVSCGVYSRYCNELGVWYFNQRNFKKGRIFLLKAIRFNKMSFKYYLRYLVSLLGPVIYMVIVRAFMKFGLVNS